MAERNRCYRYIVSAIILVMFVSPVWGAAPHKLDKPSITSAAIGKKTLKGATGVIITKDDLTRRGEVLIEGRAEGGVKGVAKVQVSLNGGKTWREAQGQESWRYRFTPVANKSYKLTCRITNTAGVTSDPKSFGFIPLTYLPITLWELVQQQADELARAYMSRDLERYMGLISKDYRQYPRGWQRLRKTIHADFKSLNNIVLRFTVNQVYELEGAIMVEMQWRLTYAGLPKPETGYVEIHFEPTDQLKVILQEKDRYFGAASRRES